MNQTSLIKYFLLVLILFQMQFVHAEFENIEQLWVPPGKLIRVGEHRLHILCMGEENDKPAIIIDSGLGGFSLEWREIQTELSKEFQICTYDRAGYGWSDPGPFPRTTKTLISGNPPKRPT